MDDTIIVSDRPLGSSCSSKFSGSNDSFIQVRLSGVRVSIAIVHIQKLYKCMRLSFNSHSFLE